MLPETSPLVCGDCEGKPTVETSLAFPGFAEAEVVATTGLDFFFFAAIALSTARICAWVAVGEIGSGISPMTKPFASYAIAILCLFVFQMIHS